MVLPIRYIFLTWPPKARVFFNECHSQGRFLTAKSWIKYPTTVIFDRKRAGGKFGRQNHATQILETTSNSRHRSNMTALFIYKGPPIHDVDFLPDDGLVRVLKSNIPYLPNISGSFYIWLWYFNGTLTWDFRHLVFFHASVSSQMVGYQTFWIFMNIIMDIRV